MVSEHNFDDITAVGERKKGIPSEIQWYTVTESCIRVKRRPRCAGKKPSKLFKRTIKTRYMETIVCFFIFVRAKRSENRYACRWHQRAFDFHHWRSKRRAYFISFITIGRTRIIQTHTRTLVNISLYVEQLFTGFKCISIVLLSTYTSAASRTEIISRVSIFPCEYWIAVALRLLPLDTYKIIIVFLRFFKHHN